jgi:hypothetical protein
MTCDLISGPKKRKESVFSSPPVEEVETSSGYVSNTAESLLHRDTYKDSHSHTIEMKTWSYSIHRTRIDATNEIPVKHPNSNAPTEEGCLTDII